MTRSSFSIYSTWGLHDELGDTVQLSEDLAFSALRALDRWADFGMKPDFFHLDAFWYDPALGYRHFHPQRWPRGFEPFLEALRERHYIPGLWFSTTGLTLEPPAWAESRCPDGHYSLVDGPYADILASDLHHAAETWGVRLFKFDFANFTASRNSRRSAEETRALAVERLTGILNGLRSAFPDIHVISHVGYARNQHHQRQGWPHPVAVDPALLEGMDAVFSGDPQCMDIPQTHLTRNLDLYQDRAVWKLHQAGFPLHRIEDHGVVMAQTNTACFRGRAGLRRSHIGQLARGGRRDLYYGDPSLPTDADLAGMARFRALYYDAWSRCLNTQLLGEGEPGSVSWHGTLTGGAARGLLTLVNPGFNPVTVRLPVTDLFHASLIFHDGTETPALQTAPDQLRVTLGPEQMVLIGLGAYAHEPLDAPGDPEVPVFKKISLLNASVRALPTVGSEIFIASERRKLLIIARAWDGKPEDPGHLLPFAFGGQPTPEGATREAMTHELLPIRARDAEGNEVMPLSRVPDVPVWSGISWVACVFPAIPGGRVEVRPVFDPPRRVEVEAYAVEEGSTET
ncbi:MAG: hypothetical protein JJU29_00085 [Verrucomicrobia bacterium]|nr:hypothetical protein [Verrucomicrobiota bacterium]MCH8511044.1 hypothetical protein [Kiritimatiellia bacterium]